MEKIDVLFAEDNENDAHLIKRILNKEALTEKYCWTKNGEETINYLLDTKNPLPRFILLDIKMPKVDGFDVLKKIKNEERTRTIPIVMYSSSFLESDIKKAYLLGANSYIIKPVGYQEMKKLFKHLIEYWILLNKEI